jgi:hypothetical protein
VATGAWTLDVPAAHGEWFTTPKTMHMWFLWMLLWFSVATAALSLLPRAPFAAAGRGLAWLARQWWGFIPLSAPLVVAGLGYDKGLLMPHLGFVPPWNDWLHNAMFFCVGLAMYGGRETLLPHFRLRWRRYALAGFVAFMVFGGVEKHLPQERALIGAAYSACAWLWGFAWLGMAQEFLNRRRPALGYLADSAYWVYLLHFPITLLFAALLAQQPLAAELKMAIGIAGTTAICLGTYQLFVRHSWISVLLNGKRHPRRGAPPVAPAASAG